jgi:hypothetical protein
VADRRDPAIKLTAAILAVDALELLVLYLVVSSGPQPDPRIPGSRDGTPHGFESALWLLLVPLGFALAAMVYLGVREIIGLRAERHSFERRPASEQRRLHHVGSMLQGMPVGAPPVADRMARKRR